MKIGDKVKVVQITGNQDTDEFAGYVGCKGVITATSNWGDRMEYRVEFDNPAIASVWFFDSELEKVGKNG